jgi:hypothetical protein
VRQDAANRPQICLKIADDFAAKSVDNGHDLYPARRVLPESDLPREETT